MRRAILSAILAVVLSSGLPLPAFGQFCLPWQQDENGFCVSTAVCAILDSTIGATCIVRTDGPVSEGDPCRCGLEDGVIPWTLTCRSTSFQSTCRFLSTRPLAPGSRCKCSVYDGVVEDY
jgi:hypothetical protein